MSDNKYGIWRHGQYSNVAPYHLWMKGCWVVKHQPIDEIALFENKEEAEKEAYQLQIIHKFTYTAELYTTDADDYTFDEPEFDDLDDEKYIENVEQQISKLQSQKEELYNALKEASFQLKYHSCVSYGDKSCNGCDAEKRVKSVLAKFSKDKK